MKERLLTVKSSEIPVGYWLITEKLVFVMRYLLIGSLTCSAFYFSLIASASPLDKTKRQHLENAIQVLSNRGFAKESFLLSHAATYRGDDNWLNAFREHESEFANANNPFGILTLYPEFFEKTDNDTERAMILLREAQQMLGASENEANSYVWKNRAKFRFKNST